MSEIFQPFLKKNIDIDAWTRKIVRWHFSEETGSDYWINKKKQLNFDPIKEIKMYSDLLKLGEFNDEDLMKIPMDSFIPRYYRKNYNNMVRVFETGGTLGIPKRIVDFNYRNDLVKWLSYSLDKHKFPHSGNWLHLAPSGPHVIGHTTAELSKIRGNSLCYYVDIDTRWIKILVKDNRNEEYKSYLNHVMSQAINILKTQNISFIMTTPKLLVELADRFNLNCMKGILLGGTHVSKSFYKLLKLEVVKDVPLCINYGNTLMGIAPQIPDNNELSEVQYYGMFPYFTLDVVDPKYPNKKVEYNKKGRVSITVLTKDYLLPNLLERDQAVRIKGNEEYNWDGVADVEPYSELKEEIIEGVY